MTMSGVSHAVSIDMLARNVRYSGSARPAWRMTQTVGCEPRSPRHARRKALSRSRSSLMSASLARSANAATGRQEHDADQRGHNAGVLHPTHPLTVHPTCKHDSHGGMERVEDGG